MEHTNTAWRRLGKDATSTTANARSASGCCTDNIEVDVIDVMLLFLNLMAQPQSETS
jgi:hypothetical protein